MRDALPDGSPDHAGLAHDVWCAPAVLGSDSEKAGWLDRVAQVALSVDCRADYEQAFNRWKRDLEKSGAAVLTLSLDAPLLVGHGNPSPTGIGLTLHQTWGVPTIPGSAIKGLVAHYVATVYGPEDLRHDPRDAGHPGAERLPFQPPVRAGRGRPPGEAFAALFGAAEVPDRDPKRRYEGRSGCVDFHDAWWLPDAGPFLKRDVLTPHQGPYFGSGGATWPNDYTDPVPVPFLVVRPGTRFLFAITGPAEWSGLARRLLREALVGAGTPGAESWGIGGKTSRGYGRFRLSPEDQQQADQEEADARSAREAGERRQEEARILAQTPAERWRDWTAQATEADLLDWARHGWKGEGLVALAREREPALAPAVLDEEIEKKALVAVLETDGFVEAWRQGRAKGTGAGGRGADKLRELAALVSPISKAADASLDRIRGLKSNDWDAFKRLSQAAMDHDEGWSPEAFQELLQRAAEFAKAKSEPKRAFQKTLRDFVRARQAK
ncbi:MAG: type III-B CRISPR module RAMP protein Cmr6 [Anaeromyxobacteraceae bacterium]|nr:type III-B CRISPR module RAMP protein Cmr6 [Anaeromyxobacteraceae bacterium]